MKATEKAQARELRQQGQSIKEICSALNVSKAAVSLWVRDITLTPEQIKRLDEKMLLARQRFSYLSRCGGANTNKADAEKRHITFEEAGYEEAKASERFRLVAALYWGEGSKSDRSKFAISNSDPQLLRLILDWLVDSGFDDRIAFRVNYYGENGLSESEIKVWWATHLPNLKEKHWRKFVKCVLNRASQRKKIGSLPQGTAVIQVSSTELFFNVMGGIKYLQQMGDW
jgi:transcriptional regulator with XRE-family HTH domain